MLTFSNKIKYSGHVSFSKNSNYFAVSKGVDLVIYDNQTLKQIQKYTFCDFIEDIQWSPNGKLILACLYKRSICELRNIENNKWYCKINEGILGVTNALFSPDSLNILTISENNIKLTIRSLTKNNYTFFINMPKFSKKGLSFSKKGNLMALAERRNYQDLIGIYFLENWTCIKKFTPQTEDLQDIQWSYDCSSLLIPDTNSVCKLFIYSPLGDLISVIEIYKLKLGIKNLEISPNGHYICLGLFDQSLRIYNNISYTCVSVFEHDKNILNDNKVNYFREELIDDKGKTKYISLSPPVNIQNENIYSNINLILLDKVPKFGVNKISISSDNNFLASKNDNMPKIIFIWDLIKMCLNTVLIQINEVSNFQWARNQNILFISAYNNKLYYFTLDSCKIAELDHDFSNNNLVLSSNGTKMILKDNDYFIVVDINSPQMVDEINNETEKNLEGDTQDMHQQEEENGEEQPEIDPNNNPFGFQEETNMEPLD